jgi:hypothetical protein
VQPGHSFHSVEEVLVGDEATGDGRQRLSISGWFHKPQEGEEGYGTEPEPAAKSSLQQLVRTDPTFTPLSYGHCSHLHRPPHSTAILRKKLFHPKFR